MNIDSNKIKKLISGFVELNENYQNKLLEHLFKLFFEQCAVKSLKEKVSGNAISDHKIAQEKDILYKESKEIHEMALTLDNEQLAQLVCFMEHINPGVFTKKEDISIQIDSKHLLLNEYLYSVFPEVSYEKTRNNLKSYLEVFNE